MLPRFTNFYARTKNSNRRRPEWRRYDNQCKFKESLCPLSAIMSKDIVPGCIDHQNLHWGQPEESRSDPISVGLQHDLYSHFWCAKVLREPGAYNPIVEK